MMRKGFTLIELLVAMAIIAILATVGLGAFFSSQVKGRDARRKSDLSQIQKALEMYFNDKGSYPPDPPGLSFGGEWKDVDSGELYMKEVPDDPRSKSGATYFYEVAPDGSWYNLYARLENTNDLCFTSSPSVCKSEGHSDTDCGGDTLCNYKVSSPNAP